MKKILAIAIAFVMVFAIASVAFAAIGFPKVAAPAEGVSLSVIGLEGTAGIFRTAPQTYNKYDQTKGVVSGTDVTFLVALTAARRTSQDTLTGTNLYVETSNLVQQDATNNSGEGLAHTNLGGTIITGGAFTDDVLDPVDFDCLYPIDAANAVSDAQSVTSYILFTGYEVDETKDATITASWRPAANEAFNATALGATDTIDIKKGGKDYAVTKTVTAVGVGAGEANYAVTIPTGTYAGWVVTFYGDSFDGANYDARYATVSNPAAIGAIGASEYTVAMNNTIVDFIVATGGTGNMMSAVNPTAYASFSAAYKEVCDIFGWSFNGSLNTFLNDAGFEAYAGSARTIKASWTYYAYTNALTVAGTAAVPDTGDMSVVGIALVVVAVIAAAAVAIKKVRA